MAGFSPENESNELDRAHELSWAILDDRITDVEMSEFEELLRTDKTARESYIRCVQLHTDLASHFAPPAVKVPAAGTKSTPILGFLNSQTPLTGLDSTTADGSR